MSKDRELKLREILREHGESWDGAIDYDIEGIVKRINHLFAVKNVAVGEIEEGDLVANFVTSVTELQELREELKYISNISKYVHAIADKWLARLEFEEE